MNIDDAVMDVDNEALRQFDLPTLRGITAEQGDGTACIWCSDALPDGIGADLGFIGDVRPHACRACRDVRIAALRSFFDWLAHVSNCPACEAERRCATSDAVQQVHVAARRQADKGPAVCADCGHEVSWAHRFKPNVWVGESSTYLLYSHTGSCAHPTVLAAVT